MALEVKLDVRLRQQLVMTPQLQQAIKILQLSLPELEAVVQSELDSNPMLEPLDHSVNESAANVAASDGEDTTPASDGEPLPPEPELGAPTENEGEWDPMTEERAPEMASSETPETSIELRETSRLDKLEWLEYLENSSHSWQDSQAPDN